MKSDSRNIYAMMLLFYGVMATAGLFSVWLEPVVGISRIVLKPLIVFPLIGFWAWGESRQKHWVNHNSRFGLIAATGVIQLAAWGYEVVTGQWRHIPYPDNPILVLALKTSVLALFWAALVWLLISYKRRPV